MTWKEIKEQIELLGIKDNTLIHFIDVRFPMDEYDEVIKNVEFKMYIHSASEIFGLGICTKEIFNNDYHQNITE
jgi:hypothetical protein